MLRRIKDNQARWECRNNGAASSNSAWGMGGYAMLILTGKLSLGVNRPDAKKAHERVVACCTQS